MVYDLASRRNRSSAIARLRSTPRSPLTYSRLALDGIAFRRLIRDHVG